MKTPLLVSLVALSALGQAVTIDRFTDGALDSGVVLGSTTDYSNRTAASVPGGFRNVAFTGITNSIDPAVTEYQVQVAPGGSINNGLGLSTGPGTRGTFSLSYSIPDTGGFAPLDLSGTPVIRANVPFNDMGGLFEVTLTSVVGGPFTVQSTARQSVGLDQFVDFDFTSAFAGASPFAARNVVGIRFSSVTPIANDFTIRSLEAVAAPVPEPSALAALGLGAAALLRRRRR